MTESSGYELFRQWSLYERVVRFNHMRHCELTAALQAAVAGLPQPLRVLDLGCGAGELAWSGFAEAAISEYFGIDLSSDAISQLKTKPPPGTMRQPVRVEGLCGEMLEELRKLPSERFDLVLASYSIHHFPAEQKPAVLTEIERVLTLGGVFIWFDLVCQDGEAVVDYLNRSCERIRREWNSLSPEEKESTCVHALTCDFPVQVSTLQAMLPCGLSRPGEQLYRDELYGGWLFRRGKRENE